MSAPSDPAASAQLPSTAATASSGLTFKLHPLVVVNVSDHYTRVKAQAAFSAEPASAGKSQASCSAGAPSEPAVPPRVFGCVIGAQRGRTVEIFNSFELVIDPVTGTLERAFLEKKLELCKRPQISCDLRVSCCLSTELGVCACSDWCLVRLWLCR
jgi:COP9 signalosome complex subunit 6